MTDRKFLTTAELAERYGVSPQTIRSWRFKRTGPPYIKPCGKRGNVYYPIETLTAWEAQRTVEEGQQP